MNRRFILIAVIVLIALFLIIGVAIPLFAAPIGASLSVQWYDSDGNPVGAPLAFVNTGGVEVASLKATVTYTVTASGELTELLVSGTIKAVVRLNTMTAGIVNTVSNPVSKSTPQGEFTQTYTLSNLIIVDEQGKTYGWVITVSCTLTATAQSGSESLTDDWSGEKSFSVTWSSGTILLSGEVVV